MDNESRTNEEIPSDFFTDFLKGEDDVTTPQIELGEPKPKPITVEEDDVDWEGFIQEANSVGGDFVESSPNFSTAPVVRSPNLPENEIPQAPLPAFGETVDEYETLQFGFSASNVIDTGIPIAPEASAFMAGAVHLAQDTYQGTLQLLGLDTTEFQREQEAMNILYDDANYGYWAKSGAVLGAVLDPATLVPGGVALKAGKALKTADAISKLSKTQKAALLTTSGGLSGGVWGGLAHVDESTVDDVEQAHIENGIMGAALGLSFGLGIAGAQKIIDNKHIKRAKQVTQQAYDDIDALRSEVGRIANDGGLTNVSDALIYVDDDILSRAVEARNLTGIDLDLNQAIKDHRVAEQVDSGLYDVMSNPATSLTKQTNGPLSVVDKVVGVLSTRVSNINKAVGGQLKRMEARMAFRPTQLVSEREDFAQYFAPKGDRKITNKSIIQYSPEDELKITEMLINGKIEDARKFFRTTRGDAAVAAFDRANTMLKKLGDEMADLGVIPQKLDNYFPRVISKSGMEDYMSVMKNKGGKTDVTAEWDKLLSETNATHLSSSGRGWSLSPFEEAQLFQRKFLKDKADIYSFSTAKGRKVQKVKEDHVQFYESPIEALDSHIHSAIAEIEKAKFLGKTSYEVGLKNANKEDGLFNLDKALKDHSMFANLDHNQALELNEILKVRFGKGMQASGKWLQGYKGIVNLSLLANPISALTQLGDLGVSAYRNGPVRATKAFAKSLMSEKDRIALEDVGIGMNRTVEFEDLNANKLRKAQDIALKWTGFSKVDALGKETFMNSAVDKAIDLSQKKKGFRYNQWAKKYRSAWGEEGFEKLQRDLIAYKNGEPPSDEVLTYAFSELSDVQPISKSEMPSGYHSNAKFMYTLKSFMLKQMDLMRTDIISKITHGDYSDKAEGIENLFKYVGMVGGANLGVDFIKSQVLGDPDKNPFQEIPEAEGLAVAGALVQGMGLSSLKIFGLSNYTLGKIFNDGILKGVADAIVPPLPLVDEAVGATADIAKAVSTGEGDIEDIAKEAATSFTRYLPVIGRNLDAGYIPGFWDVRDDGKGVPAFAEGGLVQSFKDGGLVKIDYDFINQQEDAARTLEGHIPRDKEGKIRGKSGVTVGAGFDLGQHKLEDLQGLPEEIVEKLSPYVGLKKEEAAKKLEEIPLTLEDSEYDIVTEFAHKKTTDLLLQDWGEEKFTDLTKEQQTIVASIAYQFGINGAPTFSKLAKAGLWDEVIGELKEFDGKYKEDEEGYGTKLKPSKYQARRDREIEYYNKAEPDGMVAEEVSAPVAEITRDPNDPSIAVPKPIEDRSGKMPQFMDRIMNPKKYPQIQNEDGSFSSHLMAAEMDEAGVSYAFPMIVSMPDGRLKQFKDSREALAYNKSIGNVFEAPTIEDAIKFTETYKQLNPEFGKGKDSGGPIQKEEYKEEVLSFAKGGEVKKEKAAPQKLSPGVYQDEAGELFKVTKDGDIEEL